MPTNFTLGTSTLGGARYVQKYTDEVNGEFRAIQYQITDAINNSDLEVHSIGAGIVIGGESTENV